MSGYALHAEAFGDLDEIREHIADRSPEAADRLITEIFDAIRDLAPFPQQGLPLRQPHFASSAVQVGTGICDCLCARKAAFVGCGCIPRPAKPSCNGRDS